MANHAPVDVIKISPNRGNTIDGKWYDNRLNDVCRITPHHAAGVLSVEAMLDWFSKTSTQASCNYVVGNDGRRGLCCPENVRPWTSSSRDNDNKAITVEVVNSYAGGNWPVSDKAFNSLVDLCVDICKRYGKKKLLWIADKNTALAYKPKADEMLLTMHKWFANTNCPGEYLGSKFPELARRVTDALNPKEVKPVKDPWWIEDGTWLKAKELGLMDGTRPKDNVTRAELAAVVVRLYDKLKGGDK